LRGKVNAMGKVRHCKVRAAGALDLKDVTPVRDVRIGFRLTAAAALPVAVLV